MKRQSTSKLLRLMVAVFALFLLVMAGSVLSACGGETVEENPNNNTPAEVHKHTYGTPTHQEIAKCGSTGYDVYECTECGDRYAIVTAATGEHEFNAQGVCKTCGLQLPADYQELIQTGDANLEKNLKAYLDEMLKKINEKVGEISKPAEAHTHTFTKKDELTLNASCLSAGVEVGVCSCGSQSVLKWIDPLDHDYAAIEEGRKAATCTTDGQIVMECKVCGDRYVAVNENDRAKGHDFQRELADKTLDKPANCITPALRAYKCSRCDEVNYQQFGELDPDRHTNDDTENKWVENWYEWEEGNTTTPKLPDSIKVNSTTRVLWGKCEGCGAILWKTEDKPCDHQWKPFSNVIDRTCETDGWFNAQCELCGKYANQAPTEWNKETNTFTFANTDFSNDIGDGDDTDEATKEAHEHLYKYAKTGHKNTEDPTENWEVDRNANGKVITGANQTEGDKRKDSNTTHWWSSTCDNCGLPIVVTKNEDGSVNEMTTLYLDGNMKPEQNKYSTENWKKFFSREWHSWQLYDGEPDNEENGTIEFENGGSINIPDEARGPVEATCLDKGVEWYYCIDNECRKEGNGDGRWIEIELPALGHIWEKIDIDQDPTCTKGGEVTYICVRTNGVNGRDGDESRCGHNGWDGTQEGEVDYDEDWATITFKYKADEFQKVIDGIKKEGSETEYEVKPFDWENEWRTKDEAEEGADPTYTWKPEYYTVWGKAGLWTASCGTTKDIKNGNVTVTPNKEGTEDNGECGKDVLDYFTNADGSMKHEFLEKFMPQAHLWDEDTEAMEARDEENPPTCYDGHVTIYKCVCKMNEGDCCTDAATGTAGAEATGKCPKWEKKGELEHLTKKNGEEVLPNTDTFTIYGFCGTNHTSRNDNLCHKNYKVTYCIYCYAIISVKETGEENFRHFPFDREALYGLMINNAPLKEGTTLKALMEDPTLLAECTKDAEGKLSVTNSYEKWNKDATMRQARREFVEAWKGIGKYWFEEEGRIAENNIADFIRIKSNKLECYDCFAELRSIDTTEEIMELATAYKYDDLSWALYYYVKGENGEMIRVTEDNMKTLNACEYQYYSQYKIWKEDKDGNTIFSWYSSMRDMPLTDWNNKTGTGHEAEEAALLQQILGSIGKYTEESVDKDGKAVEPTGKHYLVPAKDYSDKTKHPNFAKHEDGSVTMDWVCVFCGNTFELTVKIPTTEGAKNTDIVETTENTNNILLVDLTGVKFGDTNLNKRTDGDKDKLFQKAGPLYAQDKKDTSLATNKNGYWKYVGEGTVIITHANGSNDICVAHRENYKEDGTAWKGQNDDYFEDAKGKYCTDATLFGSKLGLDDFADPKAERVNNEPTLFEKAWAAVYSTAGIKEEDDSNGDKRLAVATRLDNLLREGGEIVVGGDLQELRKREEKTSTNFKWDVITPDAATPAAIDAASTTKINPLGTMNQKSNATKSFHVKDDGTDCAGYPDTCTDGESCECAGCKGEDGCHCVIVPILYLPAGTELDLNGHTLYANVWIGNEENGEDIPFGDDGYGHEMKAGDVTIKNGKIVMSPAAKIQVEGKDAHLTLDNVEVSGAANGIEAYNGATITIKNSNLITTMYALSSNNRKQGDSTDTGDDGKGEANFYLEDSAFISTEHTAFFMSAKGNIEATGCEFYGYNMGVYLRGHDLGKEDTQDSKKSTHAIFENCLFAKGDQASGAEESGSGEETTHFGALTIGNDNKASKSYGSIKNLVLKGCDFHIVKVAKVDPETEASGTGLWTPAFDAKDDCDLNLGEKDDTYDTTCPTGKDTTACQEKTCCHRAIVLNIFGCSELDAQGKTCMSGDDECTAGCKEQTYGKLELHLDKDTLGKLIDHAQKFSHTGASVVNPFLGCTFTDGATLLGKCMKLKIYLISETEGTAEVELNWTVPDTGKLEMPGTGA